MNLAEVFKSKTRCLEKLLELDTDLLSGRVGSLEIALNDYGKRSAIILKSFELFDKKLTKAAQSMDPSSVAPELTHWINLENKKQQKLIQRVLEIEQKIVRMVVEEQVRIQNRSANSRKERQLIGRFKSEWIAPSGESLDEKL